MYVDRFMIYLFLVKVCTVISGIHLSENFQYYLQNMEYLIDR
jgi:hypothetical protein